MPYSTQADVEFYGSFSSTDFTRGYDYPASLQKAITDADRLIDSYCQVPEGFFTAGGIEIQREHLNGTDVAYLGGITKFFNWYYGGTSHLQFKYRPVLSVTTLEEETATGTWTARTEGTDFLVVADGVRFITNTPAWKYKNVRATYRAGYTTTPGPITRVSARLATAILQDIQDRQRRDKVSAGALNAAAPAPAEQVFTEALQREVQPYRRVMYMFV